MGGPATKGDLRLTKSSSQEGKGLEHVDRDAVENTHRLTQQGVVQQRRPLKSVCSQVGNSLVTVPAFHRSRVIAAGLIEASEGCVSATFPASVGAFLCDTTRRRTRRKSKMSGALSSLRPFLPTP